MSAILAKNTWFLPLLYASADMIPPLRPAAMSRRCPVAVQACKKFPALIYRAGALQYHRRFTTSVVVSSGRLWGGLFMQTRTAW